MHLFFDKCDYFYWWLVESAFTFTFLQMNYGKVAGTYEWYFVILEMHVWLGGVDIWTLTLTLTSTEKLDL